MVDAGGYRLVFARADARRLFVATLLGWTGFAMLSLAFVLAARSVTETFAGVGVVLAAFGLGAGLLGPVRGLCVDRHGAGRVLPILAALHAASLVLAFGMVETERPLGLVLSAAAAGACAPPIAGVARAQWRSIVAPEVLPAAYAVLAVTGEAASVGGPLLTVAIALLLVPQAALLVCAGTAVLAVMLLPAVNVRPKEAAHQPIARVWPLQPAVLTLLTSSLALGVVLGMIVIVLPASAAAAHVPNRAALFLASFALGSAIGGYVYGRRLREASADRRYPAVLACFAIMLTPLIFARSGVEVSAASLLAGLLFAPASIALLEVLDTVTPESRTVTAFTWITTVESSGAAAGAAFAGQLVAAGAVSTASAVTAGFAAVAALVAALRLSVPRWRGTQSDPEPATRQAEPDLRAARAQPIKGPRGPTTASGRRRR